jgi:hypothetical protein
MPKCGKDILKDAETYLRSRRDPDSVFPRSKLQGHTLSPCSALILLEISAYPQTETLPSSVTQLQVEISRRYTQLL